MPPALDVFIDLSASRQSASEIRATIDAWRRTEQLGALAGQVRLAAPRGALPAGSFTAAPGWCIADGGNPILLLDAALLAAGQRGVPLLVLTGAVDVGCEAIGALHLQLFRDPMFGFAIPRVACDARCCIAALTKHGAGRTTWIPRKVLANLPEAEVFVETLSPCVLVAPQVAGNFGPLDRDFASLEAALLHYMSAARRCGFRTVCCNRATVGIDGLRCGLPEITPIPSLPAADAGRLVAKVPDLERCWEEFRAAAWQRFEQLCAAAPRPSPQPRPSLLFDLRNVGALYNGTTHAVLGLVKGFRENRTAWDVALLADPQGAKFHDYAGVFAGWPVYTAPPDRAFAVAFRPTQPWNIQEMADLHQCALINAYLMLDTISWDIGYWAPPRLEGVWRFLADHADGLLYDSEFTRRRFKERFPTSRHVPDRVTLFSFDAREYTQGNAAAASAAQFVLVVGNHLDHKDVRQTVATLASAFPYQPIAALGPADTTSPFVTARPSGTLSESEMHRLYASAQYVVYPSFYEGFGFPVVTALAHGRTVLARRSALLEEIAEHTDSRGRLIAFDTREHLTELLGRLLHGEGVPEMPLGRSRAGGAARTWRDAARETDDFLASLVTDDAREHWILRERALSQVLSVRG